MAKRPGPCPVGRRIYFYREDMTMNVKVEDLSSVKKKLSFEVDAEQVAEEIRKAYQKIGKKAKIKGFRPGKVPQHLIEKHYAPQMEEEVLDRLIKGSYFKALVDHKIGAISSPEIVESSPLEPGKPFTYSAHVEVKPVVEVKDYQGLKLEREKFVFDEKVVDERLEEMRAARANVEVSKRKVAREGDFAVIDFAGSVDGEQIEKGSAEDHLLELGSQSFIPGFEEQVVGMKRLEEKEFAVPFPENYGNKELAGKEALFRVTLKEIKEKVLPEPDDEFAKEVGLESLAELREKIAEDHRSQEQRRVDEELRERLMDALIAKNPIEVPETMVDRQLDYMLENARNRLKFQGLSLEMLGMSEETFRQQYRQAAVKQVQGFLILEAVARQEQLKVAPEEVEGRLQTIAAQANAPLEAVKKHYAGEDARAGLIAHLVEEKAIELILEKASVKEVAADKISGAGAEKAKPKPKSKKKE